MVPVSPSAQETVTSSPSERASVALRFRRRRESPVRGDDGRVAGASAAVGHNGGGALHDRFPVRVGHVRDEDVAGLERSHLVNWGEDSDTAGADALADGAALDQHPAGTVEAETAQAAGGPAGLHGFRARLQNVQAAVDPVLAPFDVHGAAVVVLDGDGVPGELLDVVVAEAEAVPQGSLHRDEVDGVADFAVARVGHLEGFLAQSALEDGRRPASGRACRRRTRPG